MILTHFFKLENLQDNYKIDLGDLKDKFEAKYYNVKEELENLSNHQTAFDLVYKEVSDELVTEKGERNVQATAVARKSVSNSLASKRNLTDLFMEYKKDTLGAKAALLDKTFRDSMS